MKPGPKKHVRLELEVKDHDILRTLANYRGQTILGYVRSLVRKRISRFKKGDEIGKVRRTVRSGAAYREEDDE